MLLFHMNHAMRSGDVPPVHHSPMVRIGITGVCGLIGGIIHAAFSADGHELVGIDRPTEERLARGRNVDDANAPERLDHACDISETSVEELTEMIRGCKVVFHLAADADPSNWERSMLEVNIEGTHRIIEACKEAGVERLILASSGLAQVGLEGRIDGEIGIEHGVSIDSPYGLTKIVVETIGRKASQFMRVIAVRIGTVIPDDDEHRRRGGRLMATAFLQEDVRRFFRACLAAEFEGYLLTAAQSDSPTRFISLQPGLSILGWHPVEWD